MSTTKVAFAAYLQVNTLNWVRGVNMPAAPTAVFFGLLTQQPDHDGTNLYELNDGGYARQQVTFGAPSTDMTERITTFSNTNGIIFGPASADWPQVTYGAFFTNTGTLLAYGPLAAPKVAPTGDTISFGAGSLQLRIR